MCTLNRIILDCPYPDCNIGIEIIEINCAIFRCGVYKNQFDSQYGKQINPHLSKDDCEKLKKDDKIWGCGRPFQLVKNDKSKTYQVIQCDYI